jgi:hypothetical protein
MIQSTLVNILYRFIHTTRTKIVPYAQSHKRLLIPLGLLAVLVTGGYLYYRSIPGDEFEFLSENAASRIIATQRSTIGQPFDVSAPEVARLEPKAEEQDGQTVYTFRSSDASRPNQIREQDKKVVFERIVTPSNPGQLGYETVSFFLSRYGKPELEAPGKALHGVPMTVYVFADKGFSFLGDQSTNTIAEVHVFESMSVDDYRRLWGSEAGVGN